MTTRPAGDADLASLPPELQLADWRRRVAELYALVRDERRPADARHRRWREARDALFRDHPQSPLTEEGRAGFAGLPVAAYDPAWRTVARLEPAEPERFEVRLRDDGGFRMRRAAALRFELGGAPHRLALFWIEGYGGGLFLPFRDAGRGRSTYGGGRYLLDTVKGADLGLAPLPGGGEGIVLDFNFAYHPSCVYSPAWDCPLAPAENELAIEVPVGELLRTGGARRDEAREREP